MNQAIRELFRLEPVRVKAVIGALIALALTLGIDLDGSAIMVAIDALLPIVAAVLTFITARKDVYPAAKVEAPGFRRGSEAP